MSFHLSIHHPSYNHYCFQCRSSVHHFVRPHLRDLLRSPALRQRDIHKFSIFLLHLTFLSQPLQSFNSGLQPSLTTVRCLSSLHPSETGHQYPTVILVSGFRWAPKGWRRLSADCKMLALEHVSSTIRQFYPDSYNITNRCFLIHQSQFVMLPGTASILLDSSGRANQGPVAQNFR